jgi:hypothetical protein
VNSPAAWSTTFRYTQLLSDTSCGEQKFQTGYLQGHDKFRVTALKFRCSEPKTV